MKNLKKVLALMLVCAMIFGSVAVVSAKTYPDVKADAAYAPAVSLLSSLKIIEGDDQGNFNPDKQITRAEFAKVMDVALGATGITQTATVFDDVKSDHWASGYIAYATQLGIIKGYGDGKFGPEDPVTYEQAIKMIVVALGYEPMANDNGGYPTGHMMVAADLGITKGALGKVGEPANRSVVAVLLANALNAPMMKRVKFGTDSEYAKMDGKDYAFESILTTKLNVYKIEATITANAKTALSGTTDIQKAGMVKIKIEDLLEIDPDVIGDVGETVANVAVNDSGAENMLGYYTILYVREMVSGDFEIISAATKPGKNVVVEIKDSQAYDPSKDGSVNANDRTDLINNMVYGYWENSRDTDSRIKTLDIDPSAYLMFNGVAKGSIDTINADLLTEDISSDLGYKNSLIRPKIGTIKFVDIDNDGYEDIIDVKSYATAVVDSVNPSTNRINFTGNTDKGSGTGSNSMGGSIVLDTYKNPDLKEWSITRDGKPAEIKDVAQYDIVNFVTDDFSNPTYYEIVVTSTTVEGTVTEVDSDSGKYYIDGQAYKLNNLKPVIKLEDEGVYHLDMRGNIAYVDNSVTVAKDDYAVLYRMAVPTLSDYQASLFTIDNQTIQVSILPKIKINDVYKSAIDTAYTGDDLDKMFAGSGLDFTGTTIPLSAVMNPNSIGGTNQYATTKELTPVIFLQALFGQKLDGIEAPVFNDAIIEASVDDGTANDMRIVTYAVNADNYLTAIDIPLNQPNNDDVFNFAGKYEDSKYDANLVKFDDGRTISDNTKVFYIPDWNSNDDWQVRDVSSLKDGGSYDAYFYGYDSDNGTGAIVIHQDASTLGADAPISVFFKSTTSTDDGDDVNKIYYWQNGVKVATPIVAETALDVTGAKTSVEDLKPGDVFIFDLDSKGRVGALHVLFTPGTQQAKTPIENGYADDQFANRLSVNGLDNSDWKLVSNKTNKEADAEIWFGYVYKKASAAKGTTLTIAGPDGILDNAETFLVPSDAKVVQYNAYTSSEAQVLKEATIGDISQSFFSKDTTTIPGKEMINWNTVDKDDLEYAFLRIYDGEVIEVVIVDYAN